VGSNLRSSGEYDAFFNSTNSAAMRGAHFTDVVCAGVSAVKWKANREPDEDWQRIEMLIENLSHITAERFALISTVDVYQRPIDVTEANPADEEGTPYGVHRAKLERWVAQQFKNCVIIRLPALYGPGLKKNAIHDLARNHMVEAVDPDGRFQWYDVSRLEQDMKSILASGVPLINISAEPIRMSEIGDRFFPGKLRPSSDTGSSSLYDYKTRYPEVLGSTGPYHFYKSQVFSGLENFLRDFQ
jgi:nucleoside-diphosphate-sugar epimerase